MFNIEFFSNKCKSKGQQIIISESLTKLKETRHSYTLANVWTQDRKTMFKDDNKI